MKASSTIRPSRPDRRVAIVVLAGALALAACSPDGTASTSRDDTGVIVVTTTTAPTSPAPATTPPASIAPPPTTAADSATPVTSPPSASTSAAPTSAPPTTLVMGDPVVDAETVAAADAPVDLAVRPDDPALYIVQQGGTVRRIDEAAGTDRIVLDVSDRITSGGERGLLGVAFSSDGSSAYTDFTDVDGNTTITEFAVAPDGTFDPASARVLLTVDQPYANHNAGDLDIGPDGMLYITLGDGGSGGDPERRASDPTQLLGSLLRIDPTPSGDAAYTIPPDNPFANGPLDGIDGRPEVWSWGLRNPWKIAFDPPTGRLWIADVGQNASEEVDVVGAADGHPAGWGVNFGWSAFEGTDRYNADVPETGRETFPVLTYPHDRGRCSISGGAVYRGDAVAGLAPAFVYADYCTGEVWAFDLGSGRNIELFSGLGRVSGVRTGPDGELYVLDVEGSIRRIVPG